MHMTKIIIYMIYPSNHNGNRYLEIRTTPRPLSDGTSRRGYIEALVEEVNLHQMNREKKIIVRLLLSVDRGADVTSAEDMLQIVSGLIENGEKSLNDIIVGLDFSGNPSKNSFSIYRDVLERGKGKGFKISLHCAEMDNDEETRQMIAFRPDRLGHALFLNEEMKEELFKCPIPIEICPTSNIKTLELKKHNEHPTLLQFLENKYPISINTDDVGVFSSTSSNEYFHVANEFKLTKKQVVDLVENSLSHIFLQDVHKKQDLFIQMKTECEELLKSSDI
jgi:adenosine deaminase